VIALGPNYVDSGDRLSSDIVATFESLERNYDYVLVDSVAMSEGPNAAALLQFVDALILVADTEQSTSPHLLSCIHQIRASEVDFLGVVLMQRRARRGSRRKRDTVTGTADPAQGDDRGVDPGTRARSPESSAPATSTH
jgi:Mrp family chromosome partitioning ATPase